MQWPRLTSILPRNIYFASEVSSGGLWDINGKRRKGAAAGSNVEDVLADEGTSRGPAARPAPTLRRGLVERPSALRRHRVQVPPPGRRRSHPVQGHGHGALRLA